MLLAQFGSCVCSREALHFSEVSCSFAMEYGAGSAPPVIKLCCSQALAPCFCGVGRASGPRSVNMTSCDGLDMKPHRRVYTATNVSRSVRPKEGERSPEGDTSLKLGTG